MANALRAGSRTEEDKMVKRRIFISFDHDDTAQVNGFLGLRNIIDNCEFYNHKLDREVQSNNTDYVQRVICKNYIAPASVCVVLIGNNTWRSGWVKWEIQECLSRGMGILGIRLKDTNGQIPQGVPEKHVGDWQPEKFASWINWAYENRGKQS
jgi:hypothetical protein